MAEIRAFRAFRYDLGRVGALKDVVAPPYDVIDPALQQRLYEQSPYNVIRLELTKEEAGDNANQNRYTRAARSLRDWTSDGILAQDSARALYVYHQEFTVEGKKYTRRGFLARVKLELFGTGNIYAHEETLPGPKADRLALMHATGMNLSPIFGLFPDPHSSVQNALDQAVGRALPLEATDHLGVISRLWPVTDQHVVSAVTGQLGPKPIFIADGHHRYETALKYREEKQAAGQGQAEDAPINYALMMLVGMSDPGLIILPTHRLVSGLPELKADQLAKLLAEHFEVTKVDGSGAAGARECWDEIDADGSQAVLGFGTVADGLWHVARLRAPQRMQELCGNHSDPWRELGVSVLHELVLKDIIAKQAPGAEPKCKYVHLVSEVIDAVAKKECQLAVLVPPAGMHHLEAIAGKLERMPAKSTYFYPKLLSGLLFNPLTGS